MTRRAQKGMTIPEVLISLLIFAAIASSCVYALRLAVDSRDQLSAADEKIKAFQISRTIIKEDLAQATSRSVRDEFGAQVGAYFRGNLVSYGGRAQDDEKLLAAFVRDGWQNPEADQPRSALQYVEYVYKGGALIRRAQVYLDATGQSEAIERVLFDGLTDARATYLIGETRGDLNWSDIWPVSGVITAPRAIAITLEWTDKAPLEQFFWIGDTGAGS